MSSVLKKADKLNLSLSLSLSLARDDQIWGVFWELKIGLSSTLVVDIVLCVKEEA